MRWLLCLLLCSCWYSVPPGTRPTNTHERDMLEITLSAWEETLGSAGQCREIADNVQVLYASGQDYWRACAGQCAPEPERTLCSEYAATVPYQCEGCSNECFTSNDGVRGGFNKARRIPIVVVNTAVNENRRERLLIHGFLHWIEWCSERGFFHVRHWIHDENGQVIGSDIVYGEGWREIELEVQRRAGLRE